MRYLRRLIVGYHEGTFYDGRPNGTFEVYPRWPIRFRLSRVNALSVSLHGRRHGRKVTSILRLGPLLVIFGPQP